MVQAVLEGASGGAGEDADDELVVAQASAQFFRHDGQHLRLDAEQQNIALQRNGFVVFGDVHAIPLFEVVATALAWMAANDLGRVDEILGLMTISATYLRKNQNMTIDEAVAQNLESFRIADAAGTPFVMALGMAFWCAYEGTIPEAHVLEVTQRLHDGGIRGFYLAGSLGMEDPAHVNRLFRRLRDRFPAAAFGFHIHNLSGMATANILAALDAGVDGWKARFAASAAASRCRRRSARSATSRPKTWSRCCEMGIDTGPRSRKTVAASREIATLLGIAPQSHPSRRTTRDAVGKAAVTIRASTHDRRHDRVAGNPRARSRHFIAGPYCATILGEFGAEVIKVEPPEGDSLRRLGTNTECGDTLVWLSESRNKKCVTIDLRTERGLDLLKRLAAKCDVIVENFRPGTLEKWGLGYDDLKCLNPGVVLVRISAYGQDGPMRTEPAFRDRACVRGSPISPASRAYPGRGVDLAATTSGMYGAIVRWRWSPAKGVSTALCESVFRAREIAPAYQKFGTVRQRWSRHPQRLSAQLLLTRDGRSRSPARTTRCSPCPAGRA